jgi:hypothetical protein
VPGNRIDKKGKTIQLPNDEESNSVIVVDKIKRNVRCLNAEE